MIYGVFFAPVCRYSCYWCKVTRAKITGVKGHGPTFRELGNAVEKEANKTFMGFPEEWWLKCSKDSTAYEQKRSHLDFLLRVGELSDLTEDEKAELDLL